MNQTYYLKSFFALLLCLSVYINTIAQTKVQIQGSIVGEESLSLDGIWAFKIDPNNLGEQENWYGSDLAESSWELMSVPSNWDIRNEYSHYIGKGWYRKTISIPKKWQGRTIRINFEGVYFDSKVWVNGNLLGTNNNGFLPFEFDISKYLNPSGNNTIVVCTDNSYRLGAVWNWGGIRRPVKLTANHAVRIVQQHITPIIDLVKGKAEVSVKVFLQNSDSSEKTVEGVVILAKENLYKKSLTFSTSIPANSQKEIIVKTSLSKDQVHLWHFDDPFLYDCTSTIKTGKQVLDQIHDRFGLRKIEVDNQHYTFKLNGESVRLVGFNLVPDDRTTGNTLPLWRVKEDVDLMKGLGCNMTRLTHLPVTKEMFDYLDEKGILVFPEVPLWGGDKKVTKNNPIMNDWLKRLIFNDYNHPSIIGWSVGNEIGHNPHVMEYVEAAIQLVKTLDSSRLAVMVSHTADRNPDPIQYSDLGLVNQYGKNLSPVTNKMHKLHPNKLLFYSEYGIGQFSEDLDGDIDAKSLIDSLRNKPYLMGASLWTFNDYRSSYYRTKEFSENRPWGVVDVFRQKKKAFYAFQKEYAPIRALKIENLVVNSTQTSSATIVLTPRNVLDLPAYTINNYRLVWKLKDAKGQIKQAGFEILPMIKPGDSNFNQTINWQSLNPLSLQIELVSPLNYSVYDTTIYFRKPQIPKIIYAKGVSTLLNDFHSKTGGVRVVFEKDPTATSYKIRYGVDGLTEETNATTNHYLDIPKLDFGQTYQLALVNINSAGESELSDIKKVTIGYSPAPPIIRYTEPADKGFFIGYATQEDDSVFQVQYTTRHGDYSEAKIIQSTNKGVLFVPNLQNGQTYYYRLKRFKHNFYESLWSEEITVTPDGGQTPAAPVLQGVIRKGKMAIVCFEPVKKSLGYLIEYRSSQAESWKSIKISAAQLSQYAIDELVKNQVYSFRMASLNAYGQSGYSDIMIAK